MRGWLSMSLISGSGLKTRYFGGEGKGRELRRGGLRKRDGGSRLI